MYILKLFLSLSAVCQAIDQQDFLLPYFKNKVFTLTSLGKQQK